MMDPRPPGGQADRHGGLDAVRGLAALGIVVLHTWVFAWGDAGKPKREAWELAVGELRLGLVSFFVLSGFLLCGPWIAAALGDARRPRLGAYAVRRFARIVPAYALAVAGSVAVLWGTGNGLLPPVDELWRYLLFLQNQDADTVGRLNPPLWSLGVEVSFYVVLPLLGLGLLRLSKRWALAAACAGVAAAGPAVELLLQETQAPRTVTQSLLSWFPYFAVGAAAAALAYGRRPSGRAGLALCLAGAGLVVANGAWHVLGTGRLETLVRDLPAGVGFALLFCGLLGWAASAAPVRALGALSYGIYLWHYPVIESLRTRDLWPQALPAMLAAVLVPTLLLAAASWLLVERPAISWARARTARTRPPRLESPARPRTEPRRSPQGPRPAEGRA